MFCPRCATQNSDDAKFCRACRENLKVIAQAMERRVPVVLASKLDAYLERTNERLRRDSILTFLFGVYLTLIALMGEKDLANYWFATAMTLLLPVSVLGWAAWQMLAYRRSLSSSSISAKLKPTSAPSTIYCPRCAELNEDGTKFCRKCGENLRAVSKAMTRRLPGFITNRLDRYIEKKNRLIRRDILGNAIAAAIILLVGIFSIVFAPSLFYGYLLPAGMIVFGCLSLICAGWDMVVYKRSLLSASKPAEIPSAPSTNKFGSHNPLQLSPPASVTESTTRRLDRSTEPSKKG